MRHVLPLYHVYHVSRTRADAVVFFSRRCAGESPPTRCSKFPLSGLVEVEKDAYTQWFARWLREAAPVLRPPASSGSGGYVPPHRYFRVVRSFTTPQHASMHGLSSRVGKFQGEDVESVDIVLPLGVFAGPDNAPRAALVPRVRDTC